LKEGMRREEAGRMSEHQDPDQYEEDEQSELRCERSRTTRLARIELRAPARD
jgi:hypothetical protein